MNKRELVKWLEKEKEAALAVAKKRQNKVIEDAENKEFDSIDLDKFIEEMIASYEDIIRHFDQLIDKCKGKRITVSKYHWKISYYNMVELSQHPNKLTSYIKEMINVDTEDYNTARREAIKYYNSVEKTYDDVIQTVKNLPTAKDGLEYLNKLGFDIKSIMPLEQKKQLPATISVNVDTRYLIFSNKS